MLRLDGKPSSMTRPCHREEKNEVVLLWMLGFGVVVKMVNPKKNRVCYCFLQVLIRWRRMIRNITIRNRDSRRLVFLNFLLRVKELVNSDCRFGFYMKNCIYSQLDMSRILNFDEEIRNVKTFAQKNAISYHMSAP